MLLVLDMFSVMILFVCLVMMFGLLCVGSSRLKVRLCVGFLVLDCIGSFRLISEDMSCCLVFLMWCYYRFVVGWLRLGMVCVSW